MTDDNTPAAHDRPDPPEPREDPGPNDPGHGHLVVFGGKQIRRMFLDGEWCFSVVDIIGALTDSNAPSKDWSAMKRREKTASGVELSTLCRQLRRTSLDSVAVLPCRCRVISAASKFCPASESPVRTWG
jgi:hypothetical protein